MGISFTHVRGEALFPPWQVDNGVLALTYCQELYCEPIVSPRFGLAQFLRIPNFCAKAA